MVWDTARMIENYRLSLLRVLAGLFVMAGIKPGTESVAVLPRHLRAKILRVLRSAESATRRLVVAKIRGMKIPAYVRRPARSRTRGTGAKTGVVRIPRFRLIDPRKFFAELHPNRKPCRSRPARKEAVEPRLLFRIAGFDGQPAYEEWSEAIPAPCPDDPVNAKHICRRMQALYHALSDLPKQTQRLLREIAKRAAAAPGPGKAPPLRPGFPPGYQKRPVHEVDTILYDCHCLALQKPVPPD